MGDPKFPRRLYDTPSHPWNAERIAEEKTLVRKYGLKNKREVWKAQSRLRTFRGTARTLLSKQGTGLPQIEKESLQLLGRMNRIGLLGQGSTLDDILGLGVENILTRRLQTIVYLKGLAGTPRQARQFIIHGHVHIAGRQVRVPSYLVTRAEEDAIELNPRSAVADAAHPVRARPEAVAEEPEFRPRGDRGAERGAERGGKRPPRPVPDEAEAEGEPLEDLSGEEAARDEGGDTQ